MKGFEQIETTHSFQNNQTATLDNDNAPPRTWIDAAVEVAWAQFEKRHRICIPCFLEEKHTLWYCGPRSHAKGTMMITGSKEYDMISYFDGFAFFGGPYTEDAFKFSVKKWIEFHAQRKH